MTVRRLAAILAADVAGLPRNNLEQGTGTSCIETARLWRYKARDINFSANCRAAIESIGMSGSNTFATFCSPGTKSVHVRNAEASGPERCAILAIAVPQFSTTRAAHKGVLLATAYHRATLRVVSEH